ncbi:MAG: ComEC/Rec2 family competence protein [Dysgonomonas sp.]
MLNPLSKTPFLLLLIPLIIGIVLQYFFQIQDWSIAIILLGIIAMLLSYFIPEKQQFRLRWLFGAGANLSIIGIAIISTSVSQQQSSFIFSDEKEVYRAIVLDIPQEKPNSLAYQAKLHNTDKRIICYFQKSDKARLSPGDEFLFLGEIQPFRNKGNPDDFDYVRYMYNQGFSGSVYLRTGYWLPTGNVYSSLKTKALNCRQQIMSFYKSLGFDDDQYAILSALILGYQNDLSPEVKQSFRTTGTVHVLSVSGLHVGIIYVMITFLLSFIPSRSRFSKIKPILIILLLWFYSFITGLPPSVVRASMMLTVYCVANFFTKRSNPIHALYISAFFMLLIKPFYLFDIGFQLSCISVVAILYLHPKISGALTIENKYLKKIWQMFSLSLVAQLGTFPLCLYYFGTFPTYFFAANMIIVPLVSLITYSMAGIGIAKLLSLINPDMISYFFAIPVFILKFLVDTMTTLLHFFENLPFALIENAKISLFDLLLITTFIITILIFIIYKKPKSLIVSLASILVLFTFHIFMNLKEAPDSLIIYNRPKSTEIRWKIADENYILTNESLVDGYKMVELEDQNMLVISSDKWKRKYSDKKFNINYLVLTQDNTLSLFPLTGILNVEQVILDASLSSITTRRLILECQKLNIPCYDVSQNGAYTLIF